MKQVNEPLGGSAPRKDPFGDLVRAVEGSGAKPVAPSAYGGFEPVEVPMQSDWDSFTYDPASAGAVRAEVSGRFVAPTAARATPAETRVDPADIDWQIDEALRGLSSPARPRASAPAETQSFAPARQADEPVGQHGRTLDDFDELIASELAAMRTVPVADADEDYGYEDDEADLPQRRASRGRGAVMLAGGLAVLVVAGAVGVVALSGSGSIGSGDSPLLIKADSEPFKIAPADPGGRAIPNQNKAVYERVAGVPDAAPTQHELVTAIEEPLEIAEDEPATDELPGVEVDDVALPGERGAPANAAAAAPQNETLQPRKVRTLTVRPDGTLVATDAPADGNGAPAALVAASSTTHATVLDPVAGIAPSLPFGTNEDAAITTASTVSAEPAPEPPAAPEPGPQPVRTASIPDAPRTGDGFFVQISSQPSEAAARDSMNSLTQRFGSQIGSRGVGIRTAEIPGKGTFYRVRVSAATRDEAVSLCESLKSAGGSCFVTR